MRISLVLAQRAPKAPFPRQGKRFDALFVEPYKRKKAWDGQDKDAFFRDKYAHVHAKQLKLRKEEQEKRQQRMAGKQVEEKQTPKPKPDFARQFAEVNAQNPKFEYIFGTNAVRAVLEARKCHKLFTGLKSVSEMDSSILALCRDRNIPIEMNVPTQHLQVMSEQGNHNRYVVKTDRRHNSPIDSVKVRNESLLINDLEVPIRTREFRFPLGLFIDQVTDAHNMGALIRSAHYFGADFVAVSARNSASISPVVVKASSGATEFVPILESAHPLRLFDQLRNDSWSIVASAPNKRALQQHDIDLVDVKPKELAQLNAPTLLVVGSEGDGIRTSLLQRSTHQTTLLSSQSEINSLNVSVAAAVLLHAFHT